MSSWDLTHKPTWKAGTAMTPSETRDDMTRRPSRVTFCQSSSSAIEQEEPTDINNRCYFDKSIREDYSKAVANQGYMELEGQRAKYMPEQGDSDSKFCGSHINVHSYPIPGPNDPPERDVTPIQPQTWTNWNTFQFGQSTNGIFIFVSPFDLMS